MWSGIIIIIGMMLTALVTFTAIAVWYAIRKQEIEVEKMRAKVKPVSIADLFGVKKRAEEQPKVRTEELKKDEDERS